MKKEKKKNQEKEQDFSIQNTDSQEKLEEKLRRFS